MAKKRSAGQNAFDLFNAVGMVVISFLLVYPIYYIMMASFSDPFSLTMYKGALWKPLAPTPAAYKAVLSNPNIASGYANTILYVVVGTSINMALTMLGGYVLSRRQLKWRNGLMFFITFTMLFSGGLLPRYILVRQLHIMDTIWAMTLPGAINTMNLIIMRTSFASIPDSFEESAKIDGATDMDVFLKIALPLSQATIAVLVLYYLVGQWNAWFDASIYLRTRTKYPLQLVIREILIDSQTDSMSAFGTSTSASDQLLFSNTIKYATIVVATLPILVVYPFLQKYFVKGVMIGAIKG